MARGALALLFAGCSTAPPQRMSASRPGDAVLPQPSSAVSASQLRGTELPAKPAPLPVPEPIQPPDPWRNFGSADLEHDNDFFVGPPETPGDCERRLETAGVRFKPAALPLKSVGGGVSCGTEHAVVYLGSKSGVRYGSPPLVSCGMALALGRFEALLQGHAARVFGSKVRSIQHAGTYSCRKMARYPDWVSEHSYANAIDIKAFVLESWHKVSVKSYKRDPETSADALFLRELARDSFDQGVFSVVLTPHYDALHHDHFHLDLARYRVDGT